MDGALIFPKMTNDEVILAFQGWGISITAHNIRHPTPDFVESIYAACLQHITGLTYESFKQPVDNSISALGINEDIYSAAFTTNLFLYHLSRFAKVARVEDFGAKDLFAPEPQRTSMILAAFVNFIKFTEEYCDAEITKMREESGELISEREQVDRELIEVQHEIDEIKAQLTQDEPQCEVLRKRNAGLRTKIFEIKDAQTIVMNEIQALKTEKNNLAHQKEILQQEIAGTEDSVQRTQSRIVQSPERIKKKITQMTTSAAEDKRSIASQEAKARDLQAKINALLVIEKDVRSCVEQLQTIEKEVNALQATQKELSDVRDQLEGRSVEKSELQVKRERVEKQIGNAHEKLERTQTHAEDKKRANQKTLERLKREYDQMDLERRDNDRQVEEMRGEANEIVSRMAEHLKRSETELNELLAEYWRLRHETDIYTETLANKLNMRVSSK